MKSKLKSALMVGLVTVTGVSLMRCSGGGSSGSSGSTSTPLSISGGFQAASLSSVNGEGIQTQSATEYTMVCAMLVAPFTSGSDAIDSDGSFSLTIAGASGKPIGCFLTKAGAIAAVFEFTETTSFSGASGGSTLAVNEGSTTISFPTDLTLSTDGVISVPSDQVTQNSTTAPASTWVDPTGTWSITEACMKELGSDGKLSSQCMAPSGEAGADIPQSVYLSQISATNDTDTSLTKFGLSIWRSLSDRSNCGNVEGLVGLTGWTAVGGWNTSFTGASTVDLTSLSNVNTAAAKAKAAVFRVEGGQSKTVCDATVTTPGTTTCADITWAPNWGMSAEACKLNCVMMALNWGEAEDGSSMYDHGSATCKMRYRMRNEFWNEFQEYADWMSSGRAGVLYDGVCDAAGNGCYDTINSQVTPILEVDDRGPENRFMFGELFIKGSIGTLIQKENTGKHMYQSGVNTAIECGGTRTEKLTIVQTASNKAEVTMEHTFVPDKNNAAGCATNEDFLRHFEENNNFTLKMTKQ